MKPKTKRKELIGIILIIFFIILFSFILLRIFSGKYGCKSNRFDIAVLFGQPCQTVSPYLTCDLNHDKKCNEMDKNIFDSAFGKCRGQIEYNFNADIDGDGCVVSADKDSFINSLDAK